MPQSRVVEALPTLPFHLRVLVFYIVLAVLHPSPSEKPYRSRSNGRKNAKSLFSHHFHFLRSHLNTQHHQPTDRLLAAAGYHTPNKLGIAAMVSLTPHSRNQEAAYEATYEGLINGFLTMIPSGSAVYFAMQNPGFVKRTNWQSRTALVIMPALFMFAFTSEHKLSDKMREIAQESRHSNETVQWAERQLETQQLQNRTAVTDTENTLTDLYRQSVAQSGVCIVPGDTLGLHHRAANYAAEHPLKVRLNIVRFPSHIIHFV